MYPYCRLKICRRCHKVIPRRLRTTDHIIPRHGFGYQSINGDDSNIQLLCIECHKKKSAIELWVKNKFVGGHSKAQKSLYLMLESF